MYMYYTRRAAIIAFRCIYVIIISIFPLYTRRRSYSGLIRARVRSALSNRPSLVYPSLSLTPRWRSSCSSGSAYIPRDTCRARLRIPICERVTRILYARVYICRERGGERERKVVWGGRHEGRWRWGITEID